jgi:hypothetical protein
MPALIIRSFDTSPLNAEMIGRFGSTTSAPF